MDDDFELWRKKFEEELKQSQAELDGKEQKDKEWVDFTKTLDSYNVETVNNEELLKKARAEGKIISFEDAQNMLHDERERQRKELRNSDTSLEKFENAMAKMPEQERIKATESVKRYRDEKWKKCLELSNGNEKKAEEMYDYVELTKQHEKQRVPFWLLLVIGVVLGLVILFFTLYYSGVDNPFEFLMNVTGVI